MYIEEKYWNNYIGDTDDSLTLIDYLASKGKAEIPDIRVTADQEEQEKMNMALADFASEPLAYDLSEMCPKEDMEEMAELCEELRKELFA